MTDTNWTNDAPDAIGKALADKHLRVIKEAVTMTDELLTPDALRAIEARLARWERAAEHWQRHVTSPSLDEPSPAYLHEKLVEAKSEFMRTMPTTARLLLAHIRAQDAATARLRDALAAVCEAAEVTDPDGWRSCNICEGWRPSPEEFHTPDCPVAAARALLDGGA